MSHQTTAKPIRQCLVVSKSGSSLGRGAEAVAVAMERQTTVRPREKRVGVADAACKSSGRTLCAGIMNTYSSKFRDERSLLSHQACHFQESQQFVSSNFESWVADGTVGWKKQGARRLREASEPCHPPQPHPIPTPSLAR